MSIDSTFYYRAYLDYGPRGEVIIPESSTFLIN